MREYKKWTMQVDGSSEIILYDGISFMNFDILKELCGCRKFDFLGKFVFDDNELFININDDVMDGINDHNPSGEWNSELSIWSWGIFVNEHYVVFRYYI